MAKINFTLEQLAIIEFQNDRVIAAARKAIARYRTIPLGRRDWVVLQNIRYWENVIAAMNWSSALARQQCKDANDVTKQAV